MTMIGNTTSKTPNPYPQAIVDAINASDTGTKTDSTYKALLLRHYTPPLGGVTGYHPDKEAFELVSLENTTYSGKTPGYKAASPRLAYLKRVEAYLQAKGYSVKLLSDVQQPTGRLSRTVTCSYYLQFS